MSAVVTRAPPTVTTPLATVTGSVVPSTVVSVWPFCSWLAVMRPGTTWKVSSLLRMARLPVSRRRCTTPAGSAAKASFTGANTVNGPVPLSVPVSSAACSAVTSVDSCGVAAAVCVIVCAGAAGSSTLSITWITPFLATMSAVTTCAVLRGPVTLTRPPARPTVRLVPVSSVGSCCPLVSCVERAREPITCSCRTGASAAAVVGAPPGMAAKAALVGANTVRFPPRRAPARLAVVTALTSELKPRMMALSTISRLPSITPSIRCTTPLEALMSAVVTRAPPTVTTPPATVTGSVVPSTVVNVWPFCSWPAVMRPGTTWNVSTFVRIARFPDSSRRCSTSAGRALKAGLIGAKTVNGPGPLSVAVSSAACRADTSVDSCGVAAAVWTIVWPVGATGASLSSPQAARVVVSAARESATAARRDKSFNDWSMVIIDGGWSSRAGESGHDHQEDTPAAAYD